MKLSRNSKAKTTIYKFSISLLCSTLFVLPALTFAHIGIPSTPTTSCGSIDSTDFTTHVTNQMDTRISGVSSSSAMQMFSTRGDSETVNGTTSTAWVRNTELWSNVGTDVDWTGVSPWNQPFDGYSSRYQKAGALISPRHVVLASHWHMPIGANLLFVSNTNEMIYRNLTALQQIAGTDIIIGVLDSDVPDSVTYYPIIASSTLQSLIKKYEPAPTYDIPMVVFDQEKKAIIHSLNGISSTAIGHAPYSTGARAFLSELIASGDSGSPAFIIVDDRPILLFTHYSASWGPNLGNYISEINSAMTTLGGGYQVTQYDPTCFTQYVPNNVPVFTSGSTASSTLAVQNPSTVIYRYTATDADVSDSLSFSLMSLSSVSSTTLSLNPNTYFSLSSTTGELRQIADIDNSITGNSLTLRVGVSDDGSPVASTTVSTTLNISYPTIVTASRSGSTISLTFSNTLDATSVPSASDFILKINGVARSVSDVQVSGATVSFQSSTAILGGDSLTVQYAYGSQKIRDITGAYASVITTPLSISNTHAGDIDTSFDPGTGFNGLAIVSTMSGGKLVAGGVFTTYNGQSAPRIARLNTTGSLDTTFNPGTGPNGAVTAVSPVEDGKVLIGGAFTTYNGSSTNRIARLNTDGTLDATFNIGTGANQPIYTFCTSPEGKYYAAGSFTTFNGSSTGGIVRLNTDGSIDTSFAPVSGIASSSATVRDCDVQSDGKLILSGIFNEYDGNLTKDIVRVNTDGSYDSTFVVDPNLDDYMGGIYAVSILSDNRIAVGGISSTYVELASVAVLNSTGGIDTELAADIEVDTVLDIVAMPNGKFITLGGYMAAASSSEIYKGIVQFNADGTVDSSFSATPGFVVSSGYPYAISLDSQNNIYVVGLFTSYNGISRNNVVKIFSTTEVEIPAVVSSGGGGGSSGGGSSGGGGGAATPLIILATNQLASSTATSNLLLKNIIQISPVQLATYAKALTIKETQQFLNRNGFPIAQKGAGSIGNETNFLGGLTRASLVKYQKSRSLSTTGILDSATRLSIAKEKHSVLIANTKNTILNSNIPQNKLTCEDSKFAVFPKNAIRFGYKNNASDVKSLEMFLNAHEGLSLTVNGIYSASDRNAVIKWQEKNAKAVLTPAGLRKGTGNVLTNSLRRMAEQVVEQGC